MGASRCNSSSALSFPQVSVVATYSLTQTYSGSLRLARSLARSDSVRLFSTLTHSLRLTHAIETFQTHTPMHAHVLCQVSAVAFSPPGSAMATASEDGTARVWTRSGELVLELCEGEDPVWGVTFSCGSGSLVAIAVSEWLGGSVGLWDWGVGTEQARLMGHSERVSSVRFSPDNRTVCIRGHAFVSSCSLFPIWSFWRRWYVKLPEGYPTNLKSRCESKQWVKC